MYQKEHRNNKIGRLRNKKEGSISQVHSHRKRTYNPEIYGVNVFSQAENSHSCHVYIVVNYNVE